MIHFIVNHTSATGKSGHILREVIDSMKQKNVEYKLYKTKHEGHATEIAAKLSALPEEKVTIIVVGGDGTINEVLNGITDFGKVRLGVIPSGSGNDFARGVGIEKDIHKLVNQLVENHLEDRIRKVDLGRVTYGQDTRLFGISSGVGMDAIVCKKVSESRLKKVMNLLHLGQLSYLFMTVYTLFSMKTTDISVDYGSEQKTIGKVIFFVAMNLRTEGGGVPMAPDAKPQDGVLTFSSAAEIPKWRTFFCLPILVMAKQNHLKGFDNTPSASAVIETKEPMILHADGEYLGEFTKLRFECLPGLLQLIQ